MRILVSLLTAAFLFAAIPTASHAVEGNFLVFACGFDHTAKDDPIVFPGLPGAAHNHAFLGVPGIDAFSTTTSLVHKTTRCDPPGETVEVWVPTIQRGDGTGVISPLYTEVYYRNPDTADGPVYPFPMGLRHVQGDGHNHNINAASGRWRCNSGGTYSVYIPSSCSNPNLGVEESIYFNMCWDGESLNPPNHKPLVACTGSNIRLPQINLLIQWGPDMVPAVAAGAKLSSDWDEGTPRGITAHADYWFGADPFFFTKVVERCLNAGIQCRVSNGSGTPAGSIVNIGVVPAPVVLTAAEARGLN